MRGVRSEYIDGYRHSVGCGVRLTMSQIETLVAIAAHERAHDGRGVTTSKLARFLSRSFSRVEYDLERLKGFGVLWCMPSVITADWWYRLSLKGREILE